MNCRFCIAALAGNLMIGVTTMGLAGPAPVEYAVDYQVLVRTGDVSPDANGVFSNQFGPPLLNDAGQVAFLARLLATSDAGPLDDLALYRADGSGAATLVRGGMTSATGNLLDLTLLTTLTPFTQPNQIISGSSLRVLYSLDKSGRLSMLGIDDQDDEALYRAEPGQLTTLIQGGQDTSFANGVRISQAAVTLIGNDEGESTFRVQPASGGEIYQTINSGGVNAALLVTGQALPDGRTLLGHSNYAFNNAGQTLSRLGTGSNASGYYLADASGVTKLLHTGEAAPDGLGSFTVTPGFVTPNINDVGQAVVEVMVDDIATDYRGLFFYDGTMLSEIIRSGDATFGGPFLQLASTPRINNLGNLAYIMFAGNNDIRRLVLHRNGQQILVMTDGDSLTAPISANVDNIQSVVINDLDQLLIRAVLREGGVARSALLLYDPQFGLAQIATRGLPIDGGTMTGFLSELPFLAVEPNANWKNAENSFNNQGQVALSYVLEDDTAGVAIATVTFARPDAIFADSFETLP